jgi:hypothetical protein
VPKCTVLPKQVFGMTQTAGDTNLTFVRKKKVSWDCRGVE